MFIAEVDASCDNQTNNKSSVGYRIYYKTKDSIVYEGSNHIGHMSSMQAEYAGIIQLIHKIIELKIPNVKIRTDCKGIVDAIYRKGKVHDSLAELHDELVRLLQRHTSIKIEWVPRNKNKRTDELSRNSRVNNEHVDKFDANAMYKANKYKNTYIQFRRHLFFKCPDCRELKSYESFPKKRTNEKRVCFHCMSIVGL